jgi:hypothetical protein
MLAELLTFGGITDLTFAQDQKAAKRHKNKAHGASHGKISILRTSPEGAKEWHIPAPTFSFI